jgi:hypothetical protein
MNVIGAADGLAEKAMLGTHWKTGTLPDDTATGEVKHIIGRYKWRKAQGCVHPNTFSVIQDVTLSG